MQPGDLDYVVKRTNTGLGLFAAKPIAKGKRIIEYKGPLVSNEEADRRGGKYFFGVDKKRSIDGGRVAMLPVILTTRVNRMPKP